MSAGPVLSTRLAALAGGTHARRERPVLVRTAGGDRALAGRAVVDFCSNDYLGLSTHPRVLEAAATALRRCGVGSTGSALVSGYSDHHAALEAELADFLGRERALLFPSGYLANIGVLQALSARGDRILIDRLSHASIIDAARYSGAAWRRFAHRDCARLAALLAGPAPAFVATDGVFSMDGDVAPLADLAGLCRAPERLLMVDDAHGIGVLGPGGRGSVAAAGLDEAAVPILTGTLGKALGAGGAFVAGPARLVEAVLQQARTGIFTTALPVPVVAAARAALSLLREAPDLTERLGENVRRLRAGADAAGVALAPSATPIQPLVLGDAGATMAASTALLERGFHIQGIRPPSVPARASRLRITVSAAHTPAQIDRLVAALAGLPASRGAAP